MEAIRRAIVLSPIALLALVPIACNGLHPWESAPLLTMVSSPTCTNDPTHLQRTAWESPGENEAPASTTGPDDLAAMSELSVDALIGQVLARNPTLAQMVAAWQAASARYPQVTALDDPMLTTKIGPASIGSSKVDFAYMVELSQKLPFPGKRDLKGEAAQAEASAAGRDVQDARLQLIASAQDAFYEYYLAHRALEVNDENLRLLKRLREYAKTRYEREKLGSEQDYVQVDVEIGRETERRLGLEEMRKIALARINTLMHRAPDSPLPPPPKQVTPAEPLPDASVLRSAALARRPDLQALADRIRAEEANLRLAYKEYYPDFEVMATYDAFWEQEQLRPAVALRLNLPVRRARRSAAVAEAEARLAQRRAELDKQTDQVNLQVQEAYEKAHEREQAVRVYKETILPAAEENIKAAQSAYETTKIPFLSLIEAQRSLVTLRDRYYEAVADSFRRRAALERVIGGPLGTPAAENHR